MQTIIPNQRIFSLTNNNWLLQLRENRKNLLFGKAKKKAVAKKKKTKSRQEKLVSSLTPEQKLLLGFK